MKKFISTTAYIITLYSGMDKEKNNNNILTEPIVKFFKGKNFGFLGTVNKDGSPQVTPTWIDLIENENDHEGLILVNTAIERLKQKNVSRDPRVSISIVDESNPYSMVTIKGRVVEQTTEGADAHIDNLAKRYLDAERYPAHSPTVNRIILKIKPEKIFYLPPRYTEYLQKK
ncbi:MAG TPA: PPOX class F420-dependent oxidoreductase [Candidatus Sulfopaludibacter sp.]|jgi:PPOX class probable F420-dependent enzyme|nr:PPOX class F420-dependent oxidoreductase [Candidatus Sulfopaludibacter sp.]